MLNKAAFTVVGMASFMAMACATDYAGRAGEMTQGEARLWGKEVAISGFSPFYDGTWSKSVAYNRKTGAGSVTINNYRNKVFAAFSRDGLVDRDGDDIQGRAGSTTFYPATPAGTFQNGVTAVDNTPGAPCEFAANIKKDYTGGPGPGLLICFFGFVEEVDKDLALQQAFTSMDQLLGSIWGGTVASSFTVELTSVTLNGTTIPLSNPLSVSVAHNGFRPMRAAVDLSTPGGQELLRVLLNNTQNMQPITVAAGFNGGMGISAPVYVQVAVNHDALAAGLK